jgi:anti-sigma factor RsiW
MPCDTWRGKLEAYADGEFSLAEMNALVDHLRNCAGCSTQALAQAQLKRSIALAGKRYEASAEFRSKMVTTLNSKTERSGGWLWKVVFIPAVLTLIFVLGLNFYVRRAKADREHVFSELADLHIAALASTTPVDVISTDRHTVKPWFEGKIPFTFNLPELQGTDFSLLGGKVSYLSQTPGAHLIYRFRKHEISVFIFPDAARQTANLSGPLQMRSFTFEDWAQNGLRYFVVGDVGGGDIEALSKLLHDAR